MIMSSSVAQYSKSLCLISLCIGTLIGSSQVSGDDWPQWRGPNRDAKSKESGLLKSWPADGPPLDWSVSNLGEGYASLVVANRKIHTIGNESGVIYAYGLKETNGEILWKTKIGESSRHAMSTPTVDGEFLYALDPDGVLSCLLVASGEIQWQIDFISDFGGKLQSGRGYGESPLIDGENLICTPGGDEALIVALNKATGEVVWKTAASNLGAKGKDGAAFSSIVKTQVQDVAMYVQLVGRGLVGVECSSGRLLWSYNDISADIVNIPTPVVQGDLVFSANGYNAGSVLLKLVPTGEQEIDVKEVYRLQGNQFQNHHGGVIALGTAVIGGHGSNNGLPTCVDLETGDILWKRRGPGIGSASVIYADGRFVFRYQNGVVALLDADHAGFTIEGKLQIPGAGGDSWSHPVIANGRLMLREQNSIYVYDVRGTAATNQETKPQLASAFSQEMRQALNLHGVRHSTIGRLHADTSAFDAQQFYRFGRSQTEDSAIEQIPVVRLRTDEQGQFDSAQLTLLQGAEQDFILDFSSENVAGFQFQELAQLPRLLGLELQFCTGITPQTLATISSIENLKTIRLVGTDISDESIAALSDLKNLQSLDLEVCEAISDQALPVISGFLQLRCLVLKKTAFEKLKITDLGIAHLTKLQNLEVLSLYGNRVSNAGMKSIASLQNLKVLDLSLVGITDDGVKALAPLENLEELYLLYNTGFAGPLLTDQCVETIGTFQKLRHLSLVGAKVTATSVDKLSGLKNLDQLQLQYSRLDSMGLSRLSEALPNTKITK